MKQPYGAVSRVCAPILNIFSTPILRMATTVGISLQFHYFEFNDTLQESDFQTFIQAISNDIVNWDTIKSVMANGGVTYADTRVFLNGEAEEVEEVNHSKFISGSNLCINLTEPNRVNAFYNPPNARGEDTFLATCLHDRKVLRVPCYTFHDGFSMYK